MWKAAGCGAGGPREGGKNVTTLLIGLDSADLDYMEPRLSALPNLRRLFTEGLVRRLATPADVMSACVWPTFFTGTLPGDHGQYFPIQWDPAKMELRHVGSEWLDSEPFWRPLARAGLPVTTLDVQMTFPARTPDGVEVTNWGSNTLGGFHCNQPDVAREVARRFGTHVLQPDIPVEKSPERFAAIRKGLLAGAKKRGELSRWLMKNTEWKLFVTVFQECHRAGHYFWTDTDAGSVTATDASDAGDAMLEVHRALDTEIGAILDEVDLRNTTVIVFSLLGMGPNRAQMHLVPEIVERINQRFLAGGAAVPGGKRPRRSLMKVLRDGLPAPVQERIAMAVPARVRDWVVGRAYTGALDWKETPGIPLPTGGEGYVRLNLLGREADGYLEPGSARHREYLDAVREGFLSLRRVPTGEPLVEAIIAPPERFPGPRSKYLPDLSVMWRPGLPATEVHSETLGTFRGRLKTGRDGNHRAVAFAAVAGPGRNSARAGGMQNIVDLAALVRDLSTDSTTGPG
jgi:predicted AlkP superfamily phosphohydrolase/phosphomutase